MSAIGRSKARRSSAWEVQGIGATSAARIPARSRGASTSRVRASSNAVSIRSEPSRWRWSSALGIATRRRRRAARAARPLPSAGSGPVGTAMTRCYDAGDDPVPPARRARRRLAGDRGGRVDRRRRTGRGDGEPAGDRRPGRAHQRHRRRGDGRPRRRPRRAGRADHRGRSPGGARSRRADRPRLERFCDPGCRGHRGRDAGPHDRQPRRPDPRGPAPAARQWPERGPALVARDRPAARPGAGRGPGNRRPRGWLVAVRGRLDRRQPADDAP